MSDIIDTYNTLEDIFLNKNIKMFTIFVIAVCIYLLYKKPKLRHPRIRIRIIINTLISILAVDFWIVKEVFKDNSIIDVILFILLSTNIMIGYKAIKEPIGISKMKLNILENKAFNDLSYEIDDMFDKRPWYMLDFVEKYEYNLLYARYLIKRHRFCEAYKIYSSIDEKWLFENEKNELYLRKAYILLCLGDMTRAENLLNILSNNKAPMLLMFKSVIMENKGDVTQAYIYMRKAKNNLPEQGGENIKAKIYNNYGRLREMEWNFKDAEFYYKKSIDIAKELKIKELTHITYQNLISICLLEGKIDKCNEYMREYEMLIKNKTSYDLVELGNLKLKIARQNCYEEEMRKQIRNTYLEINNRIDNKRKLFFDISALRIMSNAGMNLDIITKEIDKNIEEYFLLEMPERYFTLREIDIALSGYIGTMKYVEYSYLHIKVWRYMLTKAIDDIDKYINELEEYQVYERCRMWLEKIAVLKEYIKPYDFNNIYKDMLNIKDTYERNGLFIDAMRMDLDIADECINPSNYRNKGFNKDILEKMRYHITLVESRLKMIENHPIIYEIYIRLAYYFFILKENKKAKRYFDKFEESNVSILHYANWLQRYYSILKNELAKD